MWVKRSLKILLIVFFRVLNAHIFSLVTPLLALAELEEIQNIKERLLSSYSRLHTLLIRVAQSQPIAAEDMLNLLYLSVETGEATLDASIASLQEIQRNWN